MSRVGQQPILIPDGVTATTSGESIVVKGVKGELSFRIPKGIKAVVGEKEITIAPEKEGKQAKALWGTTRAIVANMVHGVTSGFEKKLEIHGVGYRAAVKGDGLELLVGFSHPVQIEAPKGVSFTVEKNVVTVAGIDKAQVGETAARVRKVRKPEPYKGKGIRYMGEVVRRKAGKKAAGAQ